MRFFIIQLIGSSFLVTLTVAEHGWPILSEYHGYRGPPAPLNSDGRVIDTPEVLNARAAHLAAHAEATERLAHQSHELLWDGSYGSIENNNYDEVPYTGMEETQVYRGPLAPIGNDGRVIDTPEVAKAKAAHLAAHAQAASEATPDYDYNGLYNDWDDRNNDHHVYVSGQPLHIAFARHTQPGYRGPPAPLAPDGRVIDTPEVEQAKAAHLRAHAYAAALTAHREPEFYY